MRDNIFQSELVRSNQLLLFTNLNRKSTTATLEASSKQSRVFSTLEETVYSVVEIERKQNILPRKKKTQVPYFSFGFRPLAKYPETHNCWKIIGGVLVDVPFNSSIFAFYQLF